MDPSPLTVFRPAGKGIVLDRRIAENDFAALEEPERLIARTFGRAEDLEELRKGLSIVKDEIMFLSMPLGDAFSRASEKLSGGTVQIFEDVGKGLKERRDYG